ncbi:hypothetical protein Csa_023988, partial [Cucumis sativus]
KFSLMTIRGRGWGIHCPTPTHPPPGSPRGNL